MIKENKKNKIITFLCACLMVCASALGLVSAVGTTLASSPTQPTITADYFNYNSSNFLNLFDGVYEGLTPYTFGTYVSENHFFPSPTDCNFRILSGGHTFDQYISNHFVYYYNNNTIYSSSPYYTSDNGSYYTFLLSPGFNNAEFVNNRELLDIKQDLFVIVIYGDDGIYRTYCSKTAYDLNQQYLNGYNNGEQSTDAYQSGFNDGKNDVLNNPNNYNLYTQVQYEQNYNDGYNTGVLNSQYGILSNVDIGGLVDVGGVVDGINNSDFTFNAGTITPNASLLNKLNVIFNSSTDVTAYAYIDFTFNEQYVYSRDNVINFVNLSLLPNQTSYLPVTYITNSNQSVSLIYTYNPIVENNIFTGFNIGVIGNDSSLIGNTIKRIVINYFQSEFDDLLITSDNLVKPQALSIFATSVVFDNGYKVGYIDGTRSDVVNNAYDKGVVEGFNDGYAQGLANQDNATFASMISAVIDVPINAMRNLFNFELLGINLFGFFTALFTLLVVITIVRLILGGK